MIDIQKNSLTVIRINKIEYKGVPRIDIREYVQSRSSDDKVPTKKGINVSPDQAKAVIEALGRVINLGN